MENKKKPLVIALICIAAVAAIAAGVWFLWLKEYLDLSKAPPVYVNSVASIVGLDTGTDPKYSGIVEPQETYKINKDESKTVAEILVDVGDEVHPGDVLFRYDVEAIQLSLTQAEIDLEGISQQITTLRNQLTKLEEEKKKASKDEQYAYSIQINAVELQIKSQEMESDKKLAEVEKIKGSLEHAEVLCEVDGVVKEINTGGQNNDYYGGGQSNAFITILSSGEYRIKGTVSELNISSLFEGMAVTVHSRIDPAQTWVGTIQSIDRENTASDGNNPGYYYGYDSGEKSSTYHFYVSLDDPAGLILGQHVYIEPGSGVNAQKSGLWLPAMYVGHDETGSFVWVRNEKEKLEKKVITLGDYDSESEAYEIKSGVTRTDYIAYPTDDLRPGLPTTVDFSVQEPLFPADDSFAGVGDIDDGFGVGDIDVGGSFDDYGGVGSDLDDPFTVDDGFPEEDGNDTGGEGYIE